jgi:hypothetical protein
MSTVNFNVKWSTSVKIITLIVLVIITISEYYLIDSLIYLFDWISLIGACVLPLIVFYFALESLSFIEMNETGIILHKQIAKLDIPYDEIMDVKCYKPDKSEMRYFGSGGVFGFIGKFSNAKIGTYQSYVGDYTQAFLIQTRKNKKYVLSCKNRELVISIIQTHIKK